MTTPPRARLRRALLPAAVLAAATAAVPAAASAASVAYIDGNEVWVASLDGATKVRLSGGEKTWREVAAADDGSIAATSRTDAGFFRAATFRVWSAAGKVVHDGTLSSPAGMTVYVYPVGFDISGDGQWLAYGYSNTSGFGLSQSFQTGHYVKNVGHGLIDPYTASPTGQEWPSFGPGNRLVTRSGSTVNVQAASGAPFSTTFAPWINTAATGLDLTRTDVAANGTLAAFQVEGWTGGTRTTGRIGVVSVGGLDGTLTGTVDCWLPANGIATDASISQDGTRIAWHDADGIKVAGAPSGTGQTCQLASPPVLISATGTSPSIGAADAAALAPPSAGSPTPGVPAPLGMTVPPLRASALLAPAGARITVSAPAAGRVTAVATVPAARLGRRGAPVVVARGAVTAAGAGKVTVRLRATAAGRRAKARLRGARLTVRVTHGGKAVRRVVVLR